MSGTLYIVPTPIGNLKDITYRAVEVLKNVNIILAEDTRQTLKLLKFYGIENNLMPYHKFNEHNILSKIIYRLKAGENFALVSDAGTPGISDPGFLLVRECVKENIQIITLPGATAIIPALINSGLPTDKFVFEGFLPKKGRKNKLKTLATEERTIILFISPHNFTKILNEIAQSFGKDRIISVSRELTKIHEETVRGTVNEVLNYFLKNKIRGEFTVVIQGYKDYMKMKVNKK